MALKKSVCSHCGKAFEVENCSMVYSIRSFMGSYKIAITSGKLLRGQLHYCSNNCMLNRKQGIIDIDLLLAELDSLAA